MKNLVRLFVFTLFLGISMFSISAFASSYTGAEGFGESAVPVDGLAISNLNYQFSNDPSILSSVTFNLDVSADRVSVKLNSKTPDFADCVNVTGYHWQCNWPGGIKLANMDEFRIVAVGN